MFKYERIASKFKGRIFDDLVCFDNIQDNIYELTSDIRQIDKIILKNKDKAKNVVELCVELKVKLSARCDYFEKKYANIKHLNRNDKDNNITNYYTDQFEFLI